MTRRHTVLAVSLLAAAAVALGAWWAWNRWFSERANPSMEEFPVRGIDISAHNGDIDFALLATERPDFAYVKATEGTDFIDRKFYDNARGMASIGVPAGAYHFFRFDTDGQLHRSGGVGQSRRGDHRRHPAPAAPHARRNVGSGIYSGNLYQ